MDKYIQSRIDGLKLLGFSVTKHVTGVYVALGSNNKCNVYNSKFETLVVGKEIAKISSNFLEVNTEVGREVYSIKGELLVTHKAGYNIRVNEEITYVSKDKKLQYIITKDGKEIFDVPNVKTPYCSIGNDGKIYTLTPSGDFYCGTDLIDTGITQGMGYYSNHFYVKAENNKAKVYELCTQKPINDNFYEDVSICDNKVILKIKDGYFDYYNNGIIKRLECKGVQEITFLYNVNYTKVYFKLKYDNKRFQIAKLDMEILIDEYYTYVSSDIMDKYVGVDVCEGKSGIVDLELGTCIKADSALLGYYGVVYTDNGEIHNIYY